MACFLDLGRQGKVAHVRGNRHHGVLPVHLSGQSLLGSPKKHVGKWSTTYTPLKWLQEKHADWADSFHVFRMDWDEKEVRLYADDILLNRTPLDNTVNASYKEVANPFRQPHFIILNLALGATGGDLDKLPLPQKYEIDYVRIYQKKDSPHKGTIPYRAEK